MFDAKQADIPAEKLRDYLLSPVHPIGRFKSTFFRGLGYHRDHHEKLAEDIRSLLAVNAEFVGTTNFGTKYRVRGTIVGPNGRAAVIVTVWIILSGTAVPRFVTAYPED